MLWHYYTASHSTAEKGFLNFCVELELLSWKILLAYISEAALKFESDALLS